MADIRQRFVVEVDGQNKLSVLSEGIEKVSKKSKEAQGDLLSFGKSLAGAFGIGAGLASVQGVISSIEKVGHALEAAAKRGEELHNAMIRTGVSVQALQQFDRVAQTTGSSLDSVTGAINKMQRAMELNGKVFGTVGLEASKLRQLAPEEAFRRVADAIMAIQSPSERTAAAMSIFGKSGASLLPVMEAIASGAESLAVTLSDDQVDALRRLNEEIEASSGAWSDLKEQFVASLASSPQVRDGIADIATAIRGLAQSVKDGSSGFNFLLSVFGRMAGLTGPNGIGGGIRMAATLLDQGPGPNTATTRGFKSMTEPDLIDFGHIEFLAGEAAKVAEKADKKREADQKKSLEEQERNYVEYWNSVKRHMDEEAEDWYRNEEKKKKDEEAWFKTRLEADKKFHEESEKIQEGWEKAVDEKMRKATDSWIEQLKRFGHIKFLDPDAFKDWEEKMDRISEKFGRLSSLFGVIREGLQALGLDAESFAMKLVVGLEAGAKAGQTFVQAYKAGDKMGMVGAGVGALTTAYSSGSFLGGAASGAMAGAAMGSVIPGIGTVVGGVAGGIIGGIAGIFGGKSKKKKEEEEAKRQAEEAFKQLTESLEKQYGSLDKLQAKAEKYGVTLKNALDKRDAKALQKELDELQKRMEGLQTATQGVIDLVDSMTYSDLSPEDFAKLSPEDQKKHLFQTFDDPAVAEAVASTFSTTFWAVYQREGIAAIEKLKPAWDKLHKELKDLGLDPAKMGLGRIGQLMTAVSDPKTKALLGASQAGTQILRGSMDAGIMDTKLLGDQTTLARATLDELEKQGLDATAMSDQLAALAEAYKATGQEMPEDLKKAMEEAGLQTLETQTDLLKDIRDILKGNGGQTTEHSAMGYGPKYLDRDTAFMAHQGELVSVIPAPVARSMRNVRHSALGFMTNRMREGDPEGGGGGGDRDPGATSPSDPTTTTPTTTPTSTPTATALSDLAKEIKRRPTAQPVTQVFQPNFKIDPLQTKEGREELARHLTQQFLKDLRNNPTVQYAVQRAAKTR